MSHRCAIYARYSSDKQSETSIIDQVRKCREYAERHGWETPPEYVYADEAMSGTGMDRPQLQKMLSSALGGRPPFEIILVDDTSRLSRSLADSVRTMELLKYAGRRVISVSDGLDSDSDQAEVMTAVYGLTNSMFIKGLGQKTHRGQEGQMLRGFHTGGPCYGYVSRREEHGTRHVINPEQSEVVRRIFEMYASGMSLKKIAITLNSEGVPPPRKRAGRERGGWCFTAIREMLRRTKYLGQPVWNAKKYDKRPGTNKRRARPRPSSDHRHREAPELQIVDQELWDRVQAQLRMKTAFYGREGSGNRGLLNSGVKSPYLLTGLLKCGVCGSNMTVVAGRGKREHRRYGCPQAQHRGLCSNRSFIRRDVIEQQVCAGIPAALRGDPFDDIFRKVAAALHRPDEMKNSETAMLERERREVQSKLANLVGAIAEDGYSNVLRDALRDHERKLDDIERRLSELRADSEEVDLEELRNWMERELADIPSLLNEDVDSARAELTKHISRITLWPGEVEGEAGFTVEGEWDLLGGAEACAGLVAGVGFGLDSVS